MLYNCFKDLIRSLLVTICISANYDFLLKILFFNYINKYSFLGSYLYILVKPDEICEKKSLKVKKGEITRLEKTYIN